MEDVLRFLQSAEGWVYLVVGLIGLVALQRVIAAWRDMRSALFGLERARAQRDLSSALSILVLMVILGLAEFSMVSFVAPTFPRAQILETPTVSLLTTPRPTRQATEVVTPTSFLPTLSVSGNEGCNPGVLEWLSPKKGDQVQGTVTLTGTVNVPGLGFYKYEYASSGSDNWITIAAGNGVKVNEEIGKWNTSSLVPGDYQLRLVAADNQNRALPPCLVNIRVIAP